ncbi:MAG: DnaB-like helicase C-terminal domain-containing protein [Bacilli bacterium]|jgi:replicative DNA helicase
MTPTPEILDRMPPCDIEAESQVLGSIMADGKQLAGVSRNLRPADFYSALNGILYGHLVAMHDAGDPIDMHLLLARLKRENDAQWTTDAIAHIGSCLASVGNPSHCRHYAKLVKQTAQLRHIRQVAERILVQVHQGDAEASKILADAENALGKIGTGMYAREPISFADATMEAMQQIEDILAGRHKSGCMVGLWDFDSVYGGVFPSELTILAARPGQGKTSLALQWAVHMATHGKRVYFATLEMEARELAMKQLCTTSGVSSTLVRTGRIGASQQSQIVAASQKATGITMCLHDWPEIKPVDIERAAMRYKADVVFVDYLQYVSPPDGKKNRYEQVGDISRGLKNISRRLRVPVVAAAQIGRQADQGKAQRPKLSHLRESGNIENDADLALLLWRPKEQGSEAELEVAKNRHGPTGTLKLKWDGSRTRFSTPDVADDVGEVETHAEFDQFR